MEGHRAEETKGGVGGRIPCVLQKAVVALLRAPWQQGVLRDSLITSMFILQIRLNNKGKNGAFLRNQESLRQPKTLQHLVLYLDQQIWDSISVA